MGTAASSSLQPTGAAVSCPAALHQAAPHGVGTDPALFVVDTGKARVLLDQTCPAVASSGPQCLVVWHDDFSPNDIRGVRVGATGEVLDRDQIVISAALKSQYYPAVDWGGSAYLVVWQDLRSGTYDIYGARVTADGQVLDSVGIPVCTASNIQEYPTVAAGDSCWLVVWTDYRTGTNVFGARVSFSGEVLDPAGLPIGFGNRTQTLPKVAWNGDEFLVVWKSDGLGAWTTHGARVAPDGELLDPEGFMIAGDRAVGHSAGHPAVASDGQDFCVVWQNEVEPRSIFASRVSADGKMIGDPIPLIPGATPQQEPEIAFSHGLYLVTWEQGSNWPDVWGARLSPGGVVLDTLGLVLGAAYERQLQPAVGATSRGWLAAWSDYRLAAGYSTIFGVPVDSSGAVLNDSRGIAPMVPQHVGQALPATAGGPDQELLVWESPAGVTGICGTRLGPCGELLDSSAFNVATSFGRQYTPSVARGDSVYLVVWVDGRWHSGFPKVYGGRISFCGEQLDQDGLAISNMPSWKCFSPDVAFGADLFLVVWYRDLAQDEIRAARVTETGVVLDPEGLIVSVNADPKRNPKVTFDGMNFLVVWETDYYVMAARVGIDGTVLDPYGFRVTNYEARQTRQPDVVFDGTNYLVVWTDWYSYRGYGTRVTPEAQVLDTAGVQITWGGNCCREPDVAFDGRNYVVTWMDNWSRAGIRGSLVTTDLMVIDSFDVRPPTDWGLSSPCVACGPQGGILACAGRTPIGMPWDTLSRIWAAPLGLPVGARETATSPRIQSSRLAVCPAVFRGSTRIYAGLGHVSYAVEIFDAAGKLVRKLSAKPAALWDGCDDRGRVLPAGVYVVTLSATGASECRKVVKLE